MPGPAVFTASADMDRTSCRSWYCDTGRPPVQTATADCRWRHQGHEPSPRRWYASTPD